MPARLPLSLTLIRRLCAFALGSLLALGLASGALAQSAIDVLLAKQEITELLYKYPRALDRRVARSRACASRTDAVPSVGAAACCERARKYDPAHAGSRSAALAAPVRCRA